MGMFVNHVTSSELYNISKLVNWLNFADIDCKYL